MEKTDKTIAYRIVIDEDIWKRYKATLPKSISTMNEGICRMIYKEVGEPYPGDGPSKKVEKKIKH